MFIRRLIPMIAYGAVGWNIGNLSMLQIVVIFTSLIIIDVMAHINALALRDQ